MSEDNKDFLIDIGTPSATPSIIKVIGVGGGGGNAVNHMYREGIHDVNFVVCNTDSKALADSPVQTRLQLGNEGLGAGNRPERARQAAEESIEEIRQMLNDGTKMVFITAGMGGGTGTGAAPVIAREAKAMDILTVGIVTIPFLFEGNKKIDQALDGVEEIAKQVDALLVINNERLREIYPDLNVLSAFEMADNTLSIAARSIAEIITMHGIINLDFRDVGTVLKDGGVAIMSTGYGEGENRVSKAIENALHSPLLNNNDIFNSKKVLLSISFCAEKEGDTLMMDEMNEVHEFMSKFHDDVETKWGLSTDPTLGKQVKITILATGFGINNVPGIKQKLDAEEEARRLKDAEKQEENEERRDSFYGSSGKKGTMRRRPKFFLFGLDDLDNEEIISLVEMTPTYKRSKETLSDIKSKAFNSMAIEPEITTSTAAGSVISF
ncbi:MAG: cell division protein FtsZ [Bacteroidales bacterium]|nr:cell division protein FtsZ [Bacteroidales bacterium]MCI7316123.1 cell division protein FtsZ [Bacteroidales bacterium]MDD6583871.1 cell division protein FtsZ [Bacteroidales bacterium]MDD6921836.1 cell division protein FtsZ [Bacteroidales bacterium]MEE0904655.1 cell division protein FtsZ [Prevotellamassilia sp.]